MSDIASGIVEGWAYIVAFKIFGGLFFGVIAVIIMALFRKL